MSPRARVILSMLTLYIVWGTTYLGIKVGLDGNLPPALFAGLRTLPAAGILFAISAFRGATLRVDRRQLSVLSIAGILLLVGGQYGTILAEQYIPSGLSALVVALLPLWIALAESLFPDMQRPGALGWIGLIIGFTGLGILLFPRLVGIQAGTHELIGIAIQILATWLWTAGSIYSKRNPLRVDGIVATAWEMLIAGGFTLVLGTVLGEWTGFSLTLKGAGALAYLTIVGSCIAFTAFVYALHHLPASKVMTYAYVNPVIAVFAGWLAGSVGLVPPEPVSASVFVGMIVIVAGVAMTTTAPTRPPRVPRKLEASAESAPDDPIPSEI